MMVTAKDLMELGIADAILPEPDGANHLNYDEAAQILKLAVVQSIQKVSVLNPEKRIQNRIEKFETMGRWNDG